ncbi:MAG TPA: hemerythrin domain-containing protein [Jatrophihabitantaceae bacterium]|jgi:iron-sulfur cluster repair protein YtfE (RIC family)|nr:hemerythrin domain-containing protein [Jatrophihabitantaceae bacterium]
MDESLAAALEREHHEIDAGLDSLTRDGGSPDVQGALRAIAALRRHIYLEEEFLFPPLSGGNLVAPLFVMLREHGQLWRTLDELEAALRASTDPAAVRECCSRLAVQLLHHNVKEERVIYPAADESLPPDIAARLRELLDTGALPDGWVCAKA